MRRNAFSLIELLVVVAVIALLLAIMLPNLAKVRTQARTAACGANLHALGIATNCYIEANDGTLFRYFTNSTAPVGRLWWFGLEPGGVGAGTNRTLLKSYSPLAPYAAELSAKLQCPDFPYDDSRFFQKFDQRAASYGLNLTIAPDADNPATSHVLYKRSRLVGREASIFIFADGVHFDFNPGFNEAHYIDYTIPATVKSGYAHFRHGGRAQFVMLDGHVDGQRLTGTAYSMTPGGFSAGNLQADDATSAIYGY